MLEAKAIPVAVPLDTLTYLRQRHEALHEQLQIVDEGLANNRFPDVELIDDRLKIGRTTMDISCCHFTDLVDIPVPTLLH